MTDKESSVIDHLIEVETQASAVMLSAQEEASKKINAAKAHAEELFLQRIAQQSEALENQYVLSSKQISDSEAQEINSYKEKISRSNLDQTAFTALLDDILFKKQAR